MSQSGKAHTKGLTRASLRLIWLIMVVVLVGSAIFGFRAASTARMDIDQANLNLDAAYRELENAQRLSASLTELDNQTLNEGIATRLEILRHLGLEQSNDLVEINTRQEQQVGSTTLYIRSIQITSTGSYPTVMALVDRLHNTGKLVISSVHLENAPTNDPTNKIASGAVKMVLVGNLYGLQKKAKTS